MAAVITRMRPAFKVASSTRRRVIGMKPNGIIIDELPRENPWEPYRLKLLPKKINDRWYKPGDTVYRRFRMSPGGGYWQYGDEFDYLKWQP